MIKCLSIRPKNTLTFCTLMLFVIVMLLRHEGTTRGATLLVVYQIRECFLARTGAWSHEGIKWQKINLSSLKVFPKHVDRNLWQIFNRALLFPNNWNGKTCENSWRIIEIKDVVQYTSMIVGKLTWLDLTIDRGGLIPWPARCPDLTPSEFYLWGISLWNAYKFNILAQAEDNERCWTNQGNNNIAGDENRSMQKITSMY